MIEYIDINQRVEFISPSETGDPKTVFVLRPLAASEMLDVISESKEDKIVLSGAKLHQYIVNSIVEIRNCPIADKDQAVRSLPMTIFSELLGEVNRLNKISGQDQKNS